MNIIFDTDLEPYLQGKLFTSCFVTDINGTFTPREKRWLMAIQYQPEKGEKIEDLLLETYSAERRLVAESTLARAMARLSAWFKGPSKQLPAPVSIVDGRAVYFGSIRSGLEGRTCRVKASANYLIGD